MALTLAMGPTMTTGNLPTQRDGNITAGLVASPTTVTISA